MSSPVAAVRRDVRLLFPALWGWLVCALGIWSRPGVVWLVLIAACSVALAGWAWKSRREIAGMAALTGMITSAMLGAILLGEITREQPLVIQAAGSPVVADIRLEQGFSVGMRSVDVRILRIDDQALTGGGVSARLLGFPFDRRVAFGGEARVEAFLQQAGPTDNAGWVLMARGVATTVREPGPFLSAIDGMRQGLVSLSREEPGDGGRLLPGLAIGDTSAVDRGLLEAMRVTSLSHLVAVSGSNCAIVVAIVVALVALLGGGVWARLIAGVLALVGFVILVTPEPSIIRASIMAAIVLAFIASARPVRGIPVLGVTVLILLAINPWMALDFAFALSVMATGGILLFSVPLAKKFGRFLPAPVALILALPVAAQIACQPILILLNPVIPVLAVPANALAAPAAPLATIIGMVACVFAGVLPDLSASLVGLAWWPSAYIAAIGRALSAAPFATIPWPTGWWGVLSSAALGYLALGWFLLKRGKHQKIRRVMAVAWSAVALAVMMGFLAPRALVKASVPNDWTIAQCDVGQGDALLLRSGGRVVLIDMGEDPRLLTECLDLLGIQQIDLAIISHFDRDHVGGWPAIAGRAITVWRGPALVEEDRDISRALQLSGATVIEVSAGDSVILGSHAVEVLWPGGLELSEPGNDSSVVVAARPLAECVRCLSGLFLGDIGEIPQRILVGRESLPSVDVVKVSHHGSADQFSGLYAHVNARVGLMGVGADNTYGHPTEVALDILNAQGSTPLRSDERGTLTLSRNAEGDIVFWAEREAGPG